MPHGHIAEVEHLQTRVDQLERECQRLRQLITEVVNREAVAQARVRELEGRWKGQANL